MFLFSTVDFENKTLNI